jgi:hypothetical protein
MLPMIIIRKTMAAIRPRVDFFTLDQLLEKQRLAISFQQSAKGKDRHGRPFWPSDMPQRQRDLCRSALAA